MAEQIFRSPGFYEREIDLSQRQQAPSGIPAGVISPSLMGPAFVPITVGTFGDFKTKFGTLDPKIFGPYAVNEFLKHRNALTFIRVLGAGSNESTSDIESTRIKGTVKNAGFKIASKGVPLSEDPQAGRHAGAVQFIVARHFLSASESLGYPLFTDNDSYNVTGLHASGETINLVRGVVLMASGTRMLAMDASGSWGNPSLIGDFATLGTSGQLLKKFKLVISSSAGSGFATTDGYAGLKILTASLDPSSDAYIAKILNTDPEKFATTEHLLYADFAIEDELATVDTSSDASVGILSGSTRTSATSGDSSVAFRELFGRFDTRYVAPRTPTFISQPFGVAEYDLFYVEALSDGAYANSQYKISISNLRASTDTSNPYGTFTLLVRAFDDSDTNPTIIEQFPNCSLDPKADNYIARIIGDKKVTFNFDAESEDERRLLITGKYPNKSNHVRVIMNYDVEVGNISAKCLPFGFRGIEVLKTSDTLTDTSAILSSIQGIPLGTSTARRLAGVNHWATDVVTGLTGSIVPPLPFRFKVTRGTAKNDFVDSAQAAGAPGATEVIDSRLFWGVKFERLPLTGTFSDSVLNPNAGDIANPLVSAYTKFLGIKKLDTLVTGSGADSFNNNKFTLARVALSTTTAQYNDTEITGSAGEHMREAAYIRNGKPDSREYKITDGVLSNRITLATLLAQTSSVTFNKFSEFTKFSTIMGGGFNGVNILDRDAARLNDKGSSSDTGGGAASSFTSPGLSTNVAGVGKDNNTVASYKAAVKIMTDPIQSNINILAIPGIRDSLITDNAAIQTKEYGQAIYIMDAAEYDDNTGRLFDDSTAKPDVNKTAEQFEGRAIDNNYAATYFPNVTIVDQVNNRVLEVPSSVAALAALAINDRFAYAWFAPAGFNRAALDFVRNVDVRLDTPDRNRLQAARINPIASFPRQGFVIFGQKTLQMARSALDRVNVRRLLIEVKRGIGAVAESIVFEQNTVATRNSFITRVKPILASIQANSGIEEFQVVMDATNNTADDVESNRLNGRIVVVPTKAAEFIAIDFIITNSGVSFA